MQASLLIYKINEPHALCTSSTTDKLSSRDHRPRVPDQWWAPPLTDRLLSCPCPELGCKDLLRWAQASCQAALEYFHIYYGGIIVFFPIILWLLHGKGQKYLILNFTWSHQDLSKPNKTSLTIKYFINKQKIPTAGLESFMA